MTVPTALAIVTVPTALAIVTVPTALAIVTVPIALTVLIAPIVLAVLTTSLQCHPVLPASIGYRVILFPPFLEALRSITYCARVSWQ